MRSLCGIRALEALRDLQGVVQGVSFAVLTMLTLIAVTGIVACGPGAENVTPLSKSDIPDQQLEDFVFVETELGVPRWILHAKHMSDFKSTDIVLAEGVTVDFFEPEADTLVKTSTLVADSGKLVRPNGDVRVWGDVVVETTDGVELRTDWLQWRKEAELIATTDTVLIEQDGDRMKGRGLESDPELRDVRILHDVVAIVRERP